MNNTRNTLEPHYFEAVYGANEDPWQFETSLYERDKYAATIAALPRSDYKSGFEIGCSIGVLTHQLATRCHQLLSVDVSETALGKARKRLVDAPQVRIENRMVPADFPNEQFDLILVSEVGYYLSMPDLLKTRQLMLDHLEPGGHLLLVHWTPAVHDYPLTGDEVHAVFLAEAGAGQPLRHLYGSRQETYRLDLFERSTSQPGT